MLERLGDCLDRLLNWHGYRPSRIQWEPYEGFVEKTNTDYIILLIWQCRSIIFFSISFSVIPFISDIIIHEYSLWLSSTQISYTSLIGVCKTFLIWALSEDKRSFVATNNKSGMEIWESVSVRGCIRVWVAAGQVPRFASHLFFLPPTNRGINPAFFSSGHYCDTEDESKLS